MCAVQRVCASRVSPINYPVFPPFGATCACTYTHIRYNPPGWHYDQHIDGLVFGVNTPTCTGRGGAADDDRLLIL